MCPHHSAQLVGATIDGLGEGLLEEIGDPLGLSIPADQLPRAPWTCTGCGVMDGGFARRGSRPTPRKVATKCGTVAFNARVVQCLRCGRRFSFVGQPAGAQALSGSLCRAVPASGRAGV